MDDAWWNAWVRTVLDEGAGADDRAGGAADAVFAMAQYLGYQRRPVSGLLAALVAAPSLSGLVPTAAHVHAEAVVRGLWEQWSRHTAATAALERRWPRGLHVLPLGPLEYHGARELGDRIAAAFQRRRFARLVVHTGAVWWPLGGAEEWREEMDAEWRAADVRLVWG